MKIKRTRNVRGIFMELFSRPLFPMMEQTLRQSSIKQKVIAQNIANYDTPGYKSKDVVFKNELNHALQSQEMKAKRTHLKHVDFKYGNSLSTIITKSNHLMMNNNGNNVDIDKETTDMAKNQLYYNSVIEGLNSEFQKLKLVVRGGR